VDCIFQRTEKVVVGRGQIRAVRWMRQDSPLNLMQTCVCVWPHIVMAKKHFCHIFMGTNLSETLLQSFHIDVQVDRFIALLQASQLLMGGPSTGNQSHCSVLVLTVQLLLSTVMSP
jgi:hypothetical protein